MLSVIQERTFGADTTLHPITGRPLEQGSGALHPDEQAIGHLGQMEFELAELQQKRRDHEDKFASERVKLIDMRADHDRLRPDDIVGRQGSVYALANQDAIVSSCERQSKALATQHEDLAVKIAEVRAHLLEEGIIDRYGEGAASSWRGMILQKGWSLPT